MQAQHLLLARRYTERSDRAHNGKVVTMRSNLRWCSDGCGFTCWNGDIMRDAFIIDDEPLVCRGGRRHQRIRRAPHDAGGGGGAVRRPRRPAPGLDAQ